jgi:hypothetical protein
MDTLLLGIFPLLINAIVIGGIITIFYLVYKWIRISLNLKEEQNEILKEILKKLDNK